MPTIRRATEADTEAIAQLEPTLFGSTAWSASMIREELTAAHRFYIVAEEHNNIVGYAGILCIGIEADVQTIAVTEAGRGRGLGSTLLNSLITEARSRNAEHMFLEVREDNAAAIRLYERTGFQPIARREGYYQPEGIDALVMHRPLTPPKTEEQPQ